MTLTVGIMPKSLRNPYFEDCRKGAAEAARDLGFELRWEGPAEAAAARQIEIVLSWLRDGVPVMAVSVEDRQRLSPALKRAREAGVKVLTWDADAEPEARDFTVVQATADSIAHALSFEAGRLLGGRGAAAVITSTLAAATQNAWIAEFRSRLLRDYPQVELLAVRPCDDDEDRARREALALLAAHPGLKAFVGFCSPAVPGAARAVEEARADVRVTGVSPPFLCRPYIERGTVASVVIWNTRDLGYLTASAAHAVATGALQRGASSLRAGRLGTVIVSDDQVRLGRCHIVSRGNLEKFGA
jgi:rhamnose transport system permease protein